MDSINDNHNNIIIFTIARMNPPTPGHLYLISCLINEAIKNNVNDVYIFLSKSNDDNENPIACSEKVDVLGDYNDTSNKMIYSEKQKMIAKNPELESKINSINVHVICTPDISGATPFTPLIEFIKTKEEIPDLHLILVIGGDRKEMIDSIVDIFLKKRPNVQSVTGVILGREDMGTYKGLEKEQLCGLDMKKVPDSAMSASFVRKVVNECPEKQFVDIYSSYLDPEEIAKLYQSIRHGLQLPSKKEQKPTKRKSSSVSKDIKPLKYNYRETQEGNKTILTLNKEELESIPQIEVESRSKKTRKVTTDVTGGKKTKRKSRKYKRKSIKKRKTSKKK